MNLNSTKKIKHSVRSLLSDKYQTVLFINIIFFYRKTKTVLAFAFSNHFMASFKIIRFQTKSIQKDPITPLTVFIIDYKKSFFDEILIINYKTNRNLLKTV